MTGEPKLEFNAMRTTWSEAEELCLSKGGHLASVASPIHGRKLQSYFMDNNLYNYEGNVCDYEFIWLGGTDEEREGEWTWTDGSKWSLHLSKQHW